ncbi:type II secretion system protein [Pseudorhodoferax sp. Leaf267]|uniref:type II secretion system protein n=1 Tax=Pseudorhodoferax sp. Leaf267 TaxID=1736316 RepID=UPI0009E99E5A|nr:type II secretion system protein [Pseudorhodoferax sp. Leaf267]
MRAQRGFTYLGLLLAVALTGAGLAAAGSVWSVHAQREREAELLYVGDQFRRAITAYYNDVPVGQRHRFPDKLEDLLLDKRWPTTNRHLRRVYVDPMTGSTDWGIVPAPSGGILGVYSRSGAVPLKRQGFGRLDTAFEDAATLQDWRFVYRPFEEDGAAEATQAATTGPGLPTVPLSALPQFRASPGGASNAR